MCETTYESLYEFTTSARVVPTWVRPPTLSSRRPGECTITVADDPDIQDLQFDADSTVSTESEEEGRPDPFPVPVTHDWKRGRRST